VTPPDNDIFDFILKWLWAPVVGLIAWAWNRNEKEHDMLRSTQETLRTNQSSGYSTLNDKVMVRVDEKVDEVRTEHGKRIDKLNTHIEKLFENAEKDRAAFRDALNIHSQQSTQRHIELMQAIHTGLDGKADK
tara:strand:+ start:1854 stop:2252 length:399 start_codon:yes stop_codon:yes gene_type:complete